MNQVPFDLIQQETSALTLLPTFAQEMGAILYLMQFYSWPHMVLIARVGQDTDAALNIIEANSDSIRLEECNWGCFSF